MKLKTLIPESFRNLGIGNHAVVGGPNAKRAFAGKTVREVEEPEGKGELDIYNLVTDPTNNLTKENKKAFLEAVKRFNEYSKSIYREHNLKEVSKNICALGKLAEKIAVNEADDWFDGMTVKRDMKSLQDSVKMFEQTSKEMAQVQHRLESLYESIGTSLGKYFEIKDSVEPTVAEGKKK